MIISIIRIVIIFFLSVPCVTTKEFVFLHPMRLIQKNIAQIVALCEKHRVMQLYVFGSVLTDRFNDNSDVDFIVKFDKVPFEEAPDNYFGMIDSLEKVLGRKVDLVIYDSIKNPYFKQNVDRTKQLIYG